MPLHIVHLDSTPSTNLAAAQLCEAQSPHGTVVNTDCQTAGRGQRGNTWEAAPGQNLTFSMVLRPEAWPVARQFELSMAISIGAATALNRLVPGLNARIKWPNDLYIGNRKLCGMLIENTLRAGSTNIARSIAGIGINVNQKTFSTKAPTPISLSLVTGQQYDLTELLCGICTSIMDAGGSHSKAMAVDAENAAAHLSETYHSLLWRHDGNRYRWLDTANLQMFDGRLHKVHTDGTIEIRPDNGTPRFFAFKQLAAVFAEENAG